MIKNKTKLKKKTLYPHETFFVNCLFVASVASCNQPGWLEIEVNGHVSDLWGLTALVSDTELGIKLTEVNEQALNVERVHSRRSKHFVQNGCYI